MASAPSGYFSGLNSGYRLSDFFHDGAFSCVLWQHKKDNLIEFWLAEWYDLSNYKKYTRKKIIDTNILKCRKKT